MIAHEEELQIEWEEPNGYIDWRLIFDNDNPVEVEIGIGKGRFLIQSAQGCPDKNFMGIEWAKKYLGIARSRAFKKGLQNIRFLRTEAGKFVQRAIPEASVLKYHIYFPDPWPKKRHHKRRIFQPAFVEKVAETLSPDGCLSIATDYLDYYEWMLDVIRPNSRLQRVEMDETKDPEGRTNYEIKYVREGRPIYRAIFQKKT